MRVWFIQDFTRELKVFFEVGNTKIKNFTVNIDITIEALSEAVLEVVNDNAFIFEVVLKGRSSKLKEIERYYKNKEGVNVKWL